MTAQFDLESIPNTFYRVSAKALIFDEQRRLLVCMFDDGGWELPGGGWERGETFEECLVRELKEEIGATVASVAPQAFFYRGRTSKSHPKVNLAVHVTLASMDFAPAEDNITAVRFLTKEEFLQLPFHKGEEKIKDFAEQIWAEQ